jgi:hypothetical protein
MEEMRSSSEMHGKKRRRTKGKGTVGIQECSSQIARRNPKIPSGENQTIPLEVKVCYKEHSITSSGGSGGKYRCGYIMPSLMKIRKSGATRKKSSGSDLEN